MWVFTEIADWWDSQKKESDNILDKWVEDSRYSQGAMIVAASTKALTTFGAGFVDILRIGDGVKQGTLKGVGTDALRAVAIFPVGKAAQMLKSAQGLKAATLIADPGGDICTWIASAKALVQTGQKFNGRLFASVDDLAGVFGKDIKDLEPSYIGPIMSHLESLGAKVGKIMPVSSVRDIERMIPHDGSIVIFSVDVVKNGNINAGHTLYAFRTALGQVRYMDRTVGNLVTSSFKKLSDIAPYYGTELIPYSAMLLPNIFIKSISYGGAASLKLVMPIYGIIATYSDK